jgi:effector-binding domain-containing protein
MATLERSFTVKQVPEQTFAFVVRRVVTHDEIGEFVTGALERVGRFAAAHGGAQGPPMSLVAAPDEEGGLAFEVGFPVAAGTRPEPPVEVRNLPATLAVVHRHAGPYTDLDADFYADLFMQVHAFGYTTISTPRELYLGGPNVCIPVTEIVWPIASS